MRVCVCIIALPTMPMLHQKHLFQDGTKLQINGKREGLGCSRFSIPTQLNQGLAQEPPHKTYCFNYDVYESK